MCESIKTVPERPVGDQKNTVDLLESTEKHRRPCVKVSTTAHTLGLMLESAVRLKKFTVQHNKRCIMHCESRKTDVGLALVFPPVMC